MLDKHKSKSGQAIIFLMVVMVVGLLVVVWNFDLHRVINAKIRVRNAADSAALAAARWQGKTLNMIGDLNLIQAALISAAYADYDAVHEDWEENEGEDSDEPDPAEYFDYAEYVTLHELRSRLEFVGPLAAFAVAQQAAFNNGAFHDPGLIESLHVMAEDIRYKVDEPPYDNAFKEYADLLDVLADAGVVAGSYSLNLPNHPLAQESFYSAIAQALGGWWCPFYRYRNLLSNYDGFESWSKLDTEFSHRYLFSLKLDDLTTVLSSRPGNMPGSAIPDATNYWDELEVYLGSNEVINAYGEPDDVVDGMYTAPDVEWHVYNTSWDKKWPIATYYNDETDERGGQFPFRSNVLPQYNYMGAEAGVGISAPVARGILASTDKQNIELAYKTKAKPFGFLNVEDPDQPGSQILVQPHYFGFVLPAFEEVRLIHSDIGDKILNGEFYRHVVGHLEDYLEFGPDGTQPGCRYCQLLVQWEGLDREEGLEWLDNAYSDSDNNPCKPKKTGGGGGGGKPWGNAGGGASGGS